MKKLLIVLVLFIVIGCEDFEDECELLCFDAYPMCSGEYLGPECKTECTKDMEAGDPYLECILDCNPEYTRYGCYEWALCLIDCD